MLISVPPKAGSLHLRKPAQHKTAKTYQTIHKPHDGRQFSQAWLDQIAAEKEAAKNPPNRFRVSGDVLSVIILSIVVTLVAFVTAKLIAASKNTFADRHYPPLDNSTSGLRLLVLLPGKVPKRSNAP
jgi:hypothetical protein